MESTRASALALVFAALTPALAVAQRTQLQSFNVPLISGNECVQSGRWLLNFAPIGVTSPTVNTLELLVRADHGWAFQSAPIVAPHLGVTDLWGGDVDIDDGWIVIGAGRFGFLQGTTQGTLQLMQFDASGSIISEQRIDSLDSEPTGLGYDVSLDGSLLAAGASARDGSMFTNRGEVLLYERVNNVWALLQILQPAPGTVQGISYQFGKRVHLAGDRLFVTARNGSFGAVHCFERNAAGLFVETQILTEPSYGFHDNFGDAIDASGDLLVCGGKNFGGRAVVYRHDSAAGLWVRSEVLPSQLPNPLGGNSFGDMVAVDDGVIVVGDATADGAGVARGALFVFRSDLNGVYPTAASETITVTYGLAHGLGGGPLDLEDGIISTTTIFSPAVQLETAHVFSVGPERDFCGTSNGVSTTGYHLDTFLDREAGLASNGNARRGLILSGAPTGTRYWVIGALQGDSAGSGALFGHSGLCLVPPFLRVKFGLVGGVNELSITGAGDLPPVADRFLTVGGTVYLQSFCAPPAFMGAPDWTSGIELTLD